MKSPSDQASAFPSARRSRLPGQRPHQAGYCVEMAKICQALQYQQSVVETLRVIAQAVARCLGVDGVAVVVRESNRWSVSAAASGAVVLEELATIGKEWTCLVNLFQVQPRIGRSCLVRLGCSQQNEDVPVLDQGQPSPCDRAQGGWDRNTVLLTPVCWNDKMIGFLWVDWPDDRMAPDMSMVQTVEIFADQAAIALYQHRLVMELEFSRRVLDSFTSCIPFQLKTPLTAMRGYAELLAQLYGQEVGPEGTAIIRNIKAAVDRIVVILDALLLDGVREPGGYFVNIDTTQMITALLGRFVRDIHKRGAQISMVSDLPGVCGDPLAVQQIFSELIDNALKYAGRKNTAPRIMVDGTVTGNMAHFRFQDNGLGFTSEQLSRAFDGFVRFHPDEAPGVGLGLAIARLAAERMGGTVWGESPGPGRGSIFHVMLPTVQDARRQGRKLDAWQATAVSNHNG